MTSQRRGAANRDYGKVSGRIDKKHLARLGTSERVFYTEGSPSPTRLRVVVILDRSGSMRGERMQKGMQMCRDLIEAGKNLPTVSVEVWGHTTADLLPGDTIEGGAEMLVQGDYIVVRELWRKGFSFEDFHKAANSQFMWGNEDGWALDVIGNEVQHTLAQGERALYVMVSDGQPVYFEAGRNLAHVRSVVDRLRRQGAGVISVAVAPELPAEAQRAMYGDGHYIKYDDDPQHLLRDIAKTIGRALN
jgi:hypothetical protein